MELKLSPTLSSANSAPNILLETPNIPLNPPVVDLPVSTGEVPAEGKPKKTRLGNTITLAAQDVRSVLAQQRDQGQILTTKLNILFVVNGALLTSLTISRLMFIPSWFGLAEIIGFLVNFTLLINAFLPRQIAISPNLSDNKFLERYLTLTPEEYQLRMMVNLVHTYQANQQRIDDVSQTLSYAAYVTWAIAFLIMCHVVAGVFVPVLPEHLPF
ncbi:hypothetical protein VB712_17585 [Spirulina sp. CCNP1310]|uniref:hypothetical protein n=1 Tax=Spirulina sp. CCNP1310 TaxID=3110249 RepID=UPI002B20B399|nr:hypothetical protein [Spirulina sp. CCNP1310]MEA5421041.1 hypothetical protein [Spirulina sp. CCNP1310]